LFPWISFRCERIDTRSCYEAINDIIKEKAKYEFHAIFEKWNLCWITVKKEKEKKKKKRKEKIKREKWRENKERKKRKRQKQVICIKIFLYSFTLDQFQYQYGKNVTHHVKFKNSTLRNGHLLILSAITKRIIITWSILDKLQSERYCYPTYPPTYLRKQKKIYIYMCVCVYIYIYIYIYLYI